MYFPGIFAVRQKSASLSNQMHWLDDRELQSKKNGTHERTFGISWTVRINPHSTGILPYFTSCVWPLATYHSLSCMYSIFIEAQEIFFPISAGDLAHWINIYTGLPRIFPCFNSSVLSDKWAGNNCYFFKCCISICPNTSISTYGLHERSSEDGIMKKWNSS